MSRADHVERRRRLPGLDGLRAVAVLLVLGFHLQTKTWLPGGFVGVDLFFVLSGFLITTLLIEQHSSTGRIDLLGFYARRMRRLLPALVAMLAAVSCMTLYVIGPEPGSRSPHAPSLEMLGVSLLAALGYGFNWLVALGIPHVEAMVHVWSLSIEEQFYLLWPLALVGLLARPDGMKWATRGVIGAILLSLSIPFWYWDWDWERLYYASDYRAHAMLAGCLLAMLRSHEATRRRLAESAWLRPAAALSALWLAAVATTARLDSTGLYLGGLALVVLASAIVILWAVESRPDEPVRRLLEAKPVVWLGTRSYAIYLYHLPVLIWSDVFELTIVEQAIWVCGSTGLLVELSWRCLERPVIERRGPRLSLAGLSPLRASRRSAAA